MGKLKIWLMALLGSALIIQSILVGYYSNKANRSEGERKQIAADLALTSSALAIQSFQFQSFTEIASHANQYAIRIGAEIEERKIEYRTIIKAEPCADKYIPDIIAERMLSYAESLRSSALYPDTKQTHSTTGYPAPSRHLTYAQAVLWIEPLLGLLDEANQDRKSIREIERIRMNKTPHT